MKIKITGEIALTYFEELRSGKIKNGYTPELIEIFDLSLENRILDSLELNGITFHNCSFINVDFYCSEMNSVVFENCKMKKVILRKSALNRSQFINCKLDSCDFSKTEIIKSKIIGCDFLMSDFSGAILSSSNISDTSFKNCIFYDSAISDNIESMVVWN